MSIHVLTFLTKQAAKYKIDINMQVFVNCVFILSRLGCPYFIVMIFECVREQG